MHAHLPAHLAWRAEPSPERPRRPLLVVMEPRSVGTLPGNTTEGPPSEEEIAFWAAQDVSATPGGEDYE